MFTRVRLVAAAAVVALAALGAQASGASQQHWVNVKVHAAKSGKVTLANSHGTFDVASDTDFGMKDLLAKLSGKWVRALVVVESGNDLRVTGLLGENPYPSKAKIQPATDDDSSIGSIAKHAYFVIHGDVQAEEEAGGDWYYTVHVASGGTSVDKTTGYVKFDDAKVVTF
jgi:hypothetical protein